MKLSLFLLVVTTLVLGGTLAKTTDGHAGQCPSLGPATFPGQGPIGNGKNKCNKKDKCASDNDCKVGFKCCPLPHGAFKVCRKPAVNCNQLNCGSVPCDYGVDGLPYCSKKYNNCYSNPCLNGARCVDGNGTYKCNCPAEYSGTNCQEHNDCYSNPCQNGGTCVDGVGTYTCNCPADFTGNNCEEYNNCYSNPCLNGGTCVDGNGAYTCNCPAEYSGNNCEVPLCDTTGLTVTSPLYANCKDIRDNVAGSVSGKYVLEMDGCKVCAYCDMDTAGGGWTVVANRVDGSVDFNRSWAEYKNGFGDLVGNHWLGLRCMHLLTLGGVDMRFDAVYGVNSVGVALYNETTIADEADNYRLHWENYVDSMNGMGDGLNSRFNDLSHNGMPFTTDDVDNDNAVINCATIYGGGWWWNACGSSFITLPYDGLNPGWFDIADVFISFKSIAMKFRAP